jgi:hypothetical protein
VMVRVILDPIGAISHALRDMTVRRFVIFDGVEQSQLFRHVSRTVLHLCQDCWSPHSAHLHEDRR